MINDILQQHWLTKQESKAYLAALELWTSPVSKIARKIWEWREATYYILENLEKKWRIFSIVKNKIKSYYAIEPKKMYEKLQHRVDDFLASMPELLALASSNGEKMSVQLYEWFEWFKMAYEQVILSSSEMKDWEPFMTFLGTQNINPALQKYLVKDFVPRRMKFKTKTMAIIDKKSQNFEDDSYAKYNETTHESIVIDDPIFNMSNEIIVHGKDSVSVMMYWKEELAALVIKSHTLHNALKSLFLLIWKLYKNNCNKSKKEHRKMKK